MDFLPQSASSMTRQARARVLRYLTYVPYNSDANHVATDEINQQSSADAGFFHDEHTELQCQAIGDDASLIDEPFQVHAGGVDGNILQVEAHVYSDEAHPEEEEIHVPYQDVSNSSDSDSEKSEISAGGKSSLLKDDLALWAVTNRITQSSFTNLLRILKPHHPDLPRDSRTLLPTSTGYIDKVKQIGGGAYYHFGVHIAVTNKLKSVECSEIDNINKLSLQINIDGLPLFKSTGGQFWPILAIIDELPRKEPFIIGLFYGESKPKDVNEFFSDFVDDLLSVQKSGGIKFGSRLLPIRVSSVICDTPARSFVKCVKGHSGYYGCDKCVQRGVIFENRMTFPETDSPLRTDNSFATQSYDDDEDNHHSGTSPLMRLELRMVSQFPADYMHLVCLGVMRRLIMQWKEGSPPGRLSSKEILSVSNELVLMKLWVPQEFARKPRALADVKRWKATEYRQFLLYSGPVVLRHNLPDAMYKNFLLLSVAMRILLSPSLCHSFADHAKELLVLFVKHVSDLYGKEHLVYNVHGLVHIADDAKLFGCLDNISGFPFENFLGQLKKMVRTPNYPLQQVIRRISEHEGTIGSFLSYSRHSHEGVSGVKKKHSGGPVPSQFAGSDQFKEVYLSVGFISTSNGNNCVEINNSKLGLVRNVLVKNAATFVVFEPFHHLAEFFSYPLSSTDVGIHKVGGLRGNLKVVPVSAISSKYVLLPKQKCRSQTTCDGGSNTDDVSYFIALSLLHTST